MRFFTLALSVLSASFVLPYALGVAAPKSSLPDIKERNSKTANLVRVSEKFPELFKRQPAPSGVVCKRSAYHPEHVDALLSPRDMAKFLIGRGSFTHDNGTTYADKLFQRDIEVANRAHERRGWVHNVVRDKVTSGLAQLSVHHYKRFRDDIKEDENILAVTRSTGILTRDLRALERALLEHPEFEDVQYQGWVLGKRFFQAVSELE